MAVSLDTFLQQLRQRDPEQAPFHQAAEEVLQSLWPFIERTKRYQQPGLIERLVEPERVIIFRVCWLDDNGQVQVNRGYRVQMNSAIGPYKGGLRFHPSVNLGILKFLAFEQTFKNGLTSLPMGGAKGGSDFDPKGKSDNEVMRFCQAFMCELYRHIGPNLDVPAGDIGVGAREVGYMFGMYKKLTNEFTGTFTGKGFAYGGSLLRPEATGYGLLYFVEEMLKTRDQSLEGLRVTISGAGSVAQHAARKALELGGKVMSMSDSSGMLHFPEGMSIDQWYYLRHLKNERRGSLSEMATEFNLAYSAGSNPWSIPCDVALPCATQNELHAEDARLLIQNGCFCIAEGANMPSTLPAIEVLREAGILYAPGKASNAGGVSVSGLEMSQNSQRLTWTEGEVDQKLHKIMQRIHHSCIEYGSKEGKVDYVDGANIAGFVKVADAMLAQGVI
ncbi:MAG: NADP-specific glutamate dehydrogenase [Alcanivoracaceae bacterium]|nr:NADP-specific glutamate dehydrogenase [Alcanivoracaceae bacterium]